MKNMRAAKNRVCLAFLAVSLCLLAIQQIGCLTEAGDSRVTVAHKRMITSILMGD